MLILALPKAAGLGGDVLKQRLQKFCLKGIPEMDLTKVMSLWATLTNNFGCVGAGHPIRLVSLPTGL